MNKIILLLTFVFIVLLSSAFVNAKLTIESEKTIYTSEDAVINITLRTSDQNIHPQKLFLSIVGPVNKTYLFMLNNTKNVLYYYFVVDLIKSGISDGSYAIKTGMILDSYIYVSNNINLKVDIDTDDDGIIDFYDSDDDNDGVNDSSDFLLGNSDLINTNTITPVVFIDGLRNLSRVFNGTSRVEIKDKNKIMLLFTYDFSSDNVLRLADITINKQLPDEDRGSIMIQGIHLPPDKTKTVFIDHLNRNMEHVCVKDIELAESSDISERCDGADEILVKCDNSSYEGYVCTDLGGIYKVSGLSHSAVQETYPPREKSKEEKVNEEPESVEEPEGLTCETDNDCNESEKCVDGECIETAECETNEDCAIGEECKNGKCKPSRIECETNEDCAIGEECKNGKCKPSRIECETNEDCAIGEECKHGRCKPKPPIPSEVELIIIAATLLLAIFIYLKIKKIRKKKKRKK